MKNKSGKIKRLKVLSEAARLKKYNDALEQYLRVQTARIEAMAKQYVNEHQSRAAVAQAEFAKDDVIEVIPNAAENLNELRSEAETETQTHQDENSAKEGEQAV